MTETETTPKSPIDDLEQRLAARLFRYFLASLSVIVGSAFALGSWVAKSEAKTDSTSLRLDTVERTVVADSAFKATTQSKLDVLDERSQSQSKAIERVDNKLDRVIRVYEVPK